MTDRKLLSIAKAPTSYFVYSSFSFYTSPRRPEIPGPWFVRALAEFGRAADVVRVELHRMTRDGEIVGRKEGRVNYYRPTPAAQAEIAAGARHIFGPTRRRWTGSWTVVAAQYSESQRVARERTRSLLQVEGFATLGNGVAIHPWPPSDELRRAIDNMKLREQVTVFTGARVNDDPSALASAWDLRTIARKYRRFISRYEGYVRHAQLTDRDAFALRFAVVFDFLDAAWGDPNLPSELLPDDWNGAAARDLAAGLYKQLLPGALAHAGAVAAESGTTS